MEYGIWKHLVTVTFPMTKKQGSVYMDPLYFFFGAPIVWKGRSMKNVVLSTNEAEYVAVSDLVKELKFLYQLQRSMEIKVLLPIKIELEKGSNLVSQQ